MKVCYILPKFDVKASEHVYHKYRLISELAKSCSVAVFIERCAAKPSFDGVRKVVCLERQTAIGRFFETLFRLFLLRLEGYSLFYVHYSFFGAVTASIVSRLTGAKTLYWNCGLPHLYFKSLGERGWLKSKLNDDWPLRASLKAVDFLVTGTPLMKKYYHEEFGVPYRKILVVPNQIDLARFRAKRPDNKLPVVLFVHHMSERKGAHYLVSIAQRVLKNIKAKFVIAGDGPYLEKLQSDIKRRKLGRWMTALGNVPNKEVQKLYSQADVFLMPSDEEGFPNVLLEAMAVGTPFVASDVGGVRDVVPKSALEFVVQKGNVDGFAERLIVLLSDSRLRAKLSKDGLRHVKQYDVKKVTRLFVKALRSVKP
jgi:glycosyltransferase involved in cell wall biosynthesis